MSEDREPARCAECGKPLEAGSGLCPACLLRLGLDDGSGEPTTMVDGDATRTPATPRSIGPYRLEAVLGEGGMGRVYLARQDEPVRRTVALKSIKPGVDSAETLRRFEAERRSLELMDHPSIARVLDAGVDDEGRPFFVMEYVEGVPITRYCDEHHLSTEERIGLLIRVCEAVQHAHVKGVIHRDLKPSNVLVATTDDGPLPKVIDFGIAKATGERLLEWTHHTEMGRLIGTPEYMSPEQADTSRRDVDTRTDVYALGVLLYELLVGKTPHDGRSIREAGLEEMLRQIRETELPTPSSRLGTLGDEATDVASDRRTDPGRLQRLLRGELDWITMRALEKDRERRYGSSRELAEDLARYLADEPVVARPPSTSYRLGKFVRRHRLGVGVAAAALVTLIAFAAAMAWQAGLIARERDRALEAEQRATREAEVAKATTGFVIGIFRTIEANDRPLAELTALEALERGAERAQEELSDDPVLRATVLRELAVAFEQIGLFDRALPMFEESLALREKHLEPGDPEIAHAAFSLGSTLNEKGRYDEALPYLEKALRLYEATDRDPPSAFVTVLRSLGNAHQNLGDLETAERIHRRAVEEGRAFAEEDPELYGWALDNLATTQMARNRLDEAVRLYLESIEVKKRFSPEGIDVAQGLGNLAMAYSALGRFDEARSAARQSLRTHEQVFGVDHFEAAWSRAMIGQIEQQAGNCPLAIEILERAIPVLAEQLGDEHPVPREMRASLAECRSTNEAR